MICYSRSLFVCLCPPGVSHIDHRSWYLQHSKFYSGGSVVLALSSFSEGENVVSAGCSGGFRLYVLHC